MSKTRKRTVEYFDDYEEINPKPSKNESDKRKSKRVESALRTKNIDQLMRLTEEEWE